MAVQTKIIKNKIGSVNNIKKITKAMEMVAASKMKKATASALATREYASMALSLLEDLADENSVRHNLLEYGKGDKTLLVVVASNKALCGGFNVSLSRAVSSYVVGNGGSDKFGFVTVGRNAERLARKLGVKTEGSFIQLPDELSVYDIGGLMRIIFDEFASGVYKKVAVAYNRYISAISYNALIRDVLPVEARTVRNILKDSGRDDGGRELREKHSRALYLFEPGEEEVLNEILPRLVEIQIYQGLVESFAAEQSARMFAMKNATDSAGKMVEELNFSFNRARQAGITQEISEIASGSEALKV